MEATTGTNVGVAALLWESIRIATELEDFSHKGLAYCTENQDKTHLKDACDHIKKAETLAKESPPDKICRIAYMDDLKDKVKIVYTPKQRLADNAILTQAEKCIQYWIKKHNKIQQEVKAYEKGKKTSIITHDLKTDTSTVDRFLWSQIVSIPDALYNLMLPFDWISTDIVKHAITNSKSSVPTPLFGPEATKAIKNWKEASNFCKSKGYELASLKDYCSESSLPNFHKMKGDQWAPIGDYNNGWVQVGTSVHKVCIQHKDLGSNPSWGLDETKQSYEANYILCKSDVVLYGPDAVGGVRNWQDAKDFCEFNGHKLGSLKDYCIEGLNGANSARKPVFGEMKGDQWAPIGDYNNGWAQVGTSSHRVCITHREIGSDPGWGVDKTKQPFEANYILCKKKNVGVETQAAGLGEKTDTSFARETVNKAFRVGVGAGVADRDWNFALIPMCNFQVRLADIPTEPLRFINCNIKGGVKPFKLLVDTIKTIKEVHAKSGGLKATKEKLKKLTKLSKQQAKDAFRGSLGKATDKILSQLASSGTSVFLHGTAEFSWVFDPVFEILKAAENGKRARRELTSGSNSNRTHVSSLRNSRPEVILDASFNETHLAGLRNALANFESPLAYPFPPSADYDFTPAIMSLNDLERDVDEVHDFGDDKDHSEDDVEGERDLEDDREHIFKDEGNGLDSEYRGLRN